MLGWNRETLRPAAREVAAARRGRYWPQPVPYRTCTRMRNSGPGPGDALAARGITLASVLRSVDAGGPKKAG